MEHRRATAPLWFIGGLVSVGLGGFGVIVPGLPTTVFFIVAAACFSRSSPRFEQWVLNLPGIGRTVRDYRAGLGMPRRAKIIAVTMILVVSTVSAVLVGIWPVGVAILALGVIGAAYVTFRVPTRERVLARRQPPAP
jgi:uncharacterized membrane protein YbaN (DUF454 family)